jgi:hypothetical protein
MVERGVRAPSFDNLEWAGKDLAGSPVHELVSAVETRKRPFRFTII